MATGSCFAWKKDRNFQKVNAKGVRALSAVVTERDFFIRTTTLGTFRNNIKAYPQLESFDNRAQNEKKFPATREKDKDRGKVVEGLLPLDLPSR